MKCSKLYAIAVEHRPNEFGFVDGPTPDLDSLLSTCGEKNAVIFRLYKHTALQPLYKWNNQTCKWERI